MSVEIRQLVVKGFVNDEAEKKGASRDDAAQQQPEMPASLSVGERERLIRECIDRVITMLDDQIAR